MSREEKEKRNKRTGIFVSVGSHIAVILLFIFLVAWRAPNPPLPEFGIELNFGTSDQGTGEVQPETTAAVSEDEEEAAPDTPEEVVEEVIEETTSTPIEEVTQESEEISEPVEEATEQVTPVTDIPTEAPIEEVKETPKEIAKPVEEVKKEESTPPKVLYPGKKDGAAGTTGDSKNAAEANQGDKNDAVGDQGDEEGDVDARSLYGTSGGGGGGAALSMPGWKMDSEPRPEHGAIEAAGTIEFVFKVDEKGQVISVKVVGYTVSSSLMNLYKKELEQLTLTKTSSGVAPAISEGKITFIIKAK